MKEHINNKDLFYKGDIYKVKDYIKDFVTGKTKKVERIKPKGASVNTALIELFNPQGKKIQEVLAHNIVNNKQNRQAFLNYFYDHVRLSRNNEILIKNPFINIILSDYDGAENADEICIRGNLIGWANKNTPYSGADILQGTVNLAESDTEDVRRLGYVKFVFDFPTHAGNGDINSVWWAYGNSASYKRLGHISYNVNSSGLLSNDSCCDGEFIFTVAGSGIIRKKNMRCEEVDTYDFTSTATNLRGIEWDGTNFWIADSDKIYKCDINFTAQQTIVTAITDTIQSITEHNGILFISTGPNVYLYNIDGTYIDTKAATSYGFSAIKKVKANSKYIMITGTNNAVYYIGYLDVNGDLLYKQDISDEPYVATFVSQYNFVRSNYYANSEFYLRRLSNFEHAYIGGIGAHTKLPATITKTSANAMKVTYTFDIEMPI